MSENSQFAFSDIGRFMARIPLLSIEAAERHLTATPLLLKDLQNRSPVSSGTFDDNGAILEAIRVSSSALNNALTGQSISSSMTDKRRRRVEAALRRYLLRMSLRPTPYGLFSGIVPGEVASESVVKIIGEASNTKRTRPDMGWIMELIQYLESDDRIAEELEYRFNPLTLEVGERLYCLTSNAYTDFPNDEASIRFTRLIGRIRELSNTWITLSKLKRSIAAEWPDASLAQIADTLGTLCEQGYLLSRLHPPLTGDKPIEHIRSVISKVTSIDRETLTKIDVVRQRLAAYDEAPIGLGETLLEDVLSSLSQLLPQSKVDNPLQTDMGIACSQVTLSSSVVASVCQAAELLYRLKRPSNGAPHLNLYRAAFIERYGENREIPLIELLDDRLGLGAPATYYFPPPQRHWELSIPSFPARDRLLVHLATQALRDQSLSVQLNDKLLHRLELDPSWKQRIPNSCELFFTVAHTSDQRLGDSDPWVILNPSPGNHIAGRSFGRFHDLFPETLQTILTDIAQHDEAHYSDLLVELVVSPKSAAQGNVTQRPTFLRHELVGNAQPGVDDTHVFNVAEILVGVEHDRFYLRSATRGCRIAIRETHRYNTALHQNFFRFLAEVSAEDHYFSAFDWGAANDLPFLPRLEVDNIVLSLARWIIVPYSEDRNQCRRDLRDFIDSWHVPNLVYAIEADNRILINTDQSDDFDVLVNQLSKGRTVLLHEVFPSIADQAWAVDERGNHYVAEFVLPMISSSLGDAAKQISAEALETNNGIAPVTMVNSGDIERVLIPGDPCIYLKLYSAEDVQNEIIANWFSRLLQPLLSNNELTSWFFIRYRDPQPHLRLRLFGDSDALWSEALSEINRWTKELIQARLIQKFEIGSYEREIERYGGPDGVRLAEKVFAIDSACTMEIINLNHRQGISLDRDHLGAFSVIQLLQSLGLSYEDCQRLFSSFIFSHEQKRSENLRGRYSAMRSQIRRWLLNKEKTGEASDLLSSEVLSALEWRTKALAIVHIEHSNSKSNFSGLPLRVAGSLVHMHVNRLFGINRTEEQGLYYLLRRGYEERSYIRSSIKTGGND